MGWILIFSQFEAYAADLCTQPQKARFSGEDKYVKTWVLVARASAAIVR
jgi:hypothetical protein